MHSAAHLQAAPPPPQCYCFVCDVPVAECEEWGTGLSATDVRGGWGREAFPCPPFERRQLPVQLQRPLPSAPSWRPDLATSHSPPTLPQHCNAHPGSDFFAALKRTRKAAAARAAAAAAAPSPPGAAVQQQQQQAAARPSYWDALTSGRALAALTGARPRAGGKAKKSKGRGKASAAAYLAHLVGSPRRAQAQAPGLRPCHLTAIPNPVGARGGGGRHQQQGLCWLSLWVLVSCACGASACAAWLPAPTCWCWSLPHELC